MSSRVVDPLPTVLPDADAIWSRATEDDAAASTARSPTASTAREGNGISCLLNYCALQARWLPPPPPPWHE